MLDAGHGGKDPGAVFEGRKEKDDNLQLALALGDILENRGVDVRYTRMEDIYQSPFEKATKANEEGVDYFVSFHRNAAEEPGNGSGVQTLVYNDQGIKAELARNINQELEKLGFKNLGVDERPNLVVLKRTKMPVVLIEAGFIDNEKDNELFDQKFYQMAEAIADGIINTLDQVQTETKADEEKSYQLYRVQVGAFENHPYAEQMVTQLQTMGFPAYILFDHKFYKVQVGAYRVLDNAVRMEDKLRSMGYPTYITTN